MPGAAARAGGVGAPSTPQADSKITIPSARTMA